jgi:hypothetical protein
MSNIAMIVTTFIALKYPKTRLWKKLFAKKWSLQNNFLIHWFISTCVYCVNSNFTKFLIFKKLHFYYFLFKKHYNFI